MTSVTEYLEQILELTQKNLDILKGINDSFYSRLNHLTINVGDETFIMPSYLYLENQINGLSENFYNLVHAPESGEAYFNLSGDSRAIEVKGYSNTPNKLNLNLINNFLAKKNDFFEKIMNPNIYIKFNLSDCPDDINSVVVKRIEINNDKLRDKILSLNKENPTSVYQIDYPDFYKMILTDNDGNLFNNDVDYKESEEIIKLPIHKNIGTGTYIVEKIINNIITDNLEQFITFKIRTKNLSDKYMSNLKYKLFDETILNNLLIGDALTTYDGKCKFKITNLNIDNSTMEVLVVNGEYSNLFECDPSIDEKNIPDLSKLKFFETINKLLDKTININLYNDKYVYISIAALNDRMNIRSPWGTGLFINPKLLTYADTDQNLINYYKNIDNIGSILKEMSHSLYNNISSLGVDLFKKISNISPKLTKNTLSVEQINTHLNNSKSALTIRKLYKLKEDIKIKIEDKQKEIDNCKNELSNISFDDTILIRQNKEEELKTLESEKNNLLNSFTNIVNEIVKVANESEIPLEDAKYRIRGWFDYKNFIKELNIDEITEEHIIGIKVLYRYRNPSRPQGEALSMMNTDLTKTTNSVFLFSDWNQMPFDLRIKKPLLENGELKFKPDVYNNTINIPSFNLIDIPISQGEIVDIKLKVIYDYGYPFAETSSDWSNIVIMSFPEEFTTNIKLSTIIEENNNDIETNKFNNILNEKGIITHTKDELIDQNITYFHRPEHISSGFYTEERRIIPLKDKLIEFEDHINELLSEVNGDPSLNLNVTLNLGKNFYQLKPYYTNNILVAPYSKFKNSSNLPQGQYEYNSKTGIVKTILYLNISNKNNIDILKETNNIRIDGFNLKPVKLYSMFPGSNDTKLYDLIYTKFDKRDYTDINNKKLGVWMKCINPNNLTLNDPNIILKKFSNSATISSYDNILLTANQFITFRLNNISNGKKYYNIDMKDSPAIEINKVWGTSNLLLATNNIELPIDTWGATLYPYLNNPDQLNITNNNSIYSYELINNSHTVSIPLVFEYNLNKKNQVLTLENEISKTISFDIRTSLYTEPISYVVQIIAKYQNSDLDNLTIMNPDDIKYNITVKE